MLDISKGCRRLITLSCVVLLTALPAAGLTDEPQTDWIKIFAAERTGNIVRLFFVASAWPERYKGMVIKRRRAAQEPGPWEDVTKTPLFPRAFPKVTWENIDGRPGRALVLQQKAKNFLDDSKHEFWKAFGDKKAMEELRQGEDRADLLNAPYTEFYSSKKFDVLLLCGLGQIDILKETKPMEYGLFPAIGNTQPANPVRTVTLTSSPDLRDLVARNVAVRPRSRNRLRITLEIDDRLCRSYCFERLEVLRAPADKPEVLKRVGFCRNSGHRVFLTKDNFRKFRFDDDAKKGFDTQKSYIYKLVPTNFFFTELKKSFLIRYPQVDEKKVDPQPAKILQALPIGKNEIQIRWGVPEDARHKIHGFLILRTEPETDKTVTLTKELLPSQAREFVDYGPFKMHGHYVYRVIVETQSGRAVPSDGKPVIYEFVPKVNGVKAKRIYKDGRRYIRCTWDPPSTSEQKWIKGYVVGDAHDSDWFSHDAGRDLITDFKYDVPTSNLNATTYTVGVAVITTWNKLGEFSKVDIKVPGRLWRPPGRPTFSDLSPNKVYSTMTWSYPDNEQLVGFRIYAYSQKGKEETRKRMIMDEKTLTRHTRSVRLGPHLPHVQYFYSVFAVDLAGSTSAESTPGLYEYSRNRRFVFLDKGEIMKIRSELSDLKATFHEDPMGPDFVDVSWDLAKDDLDLVRYYLVQPEQKDAAVGEMPAKTTDKRIRIPIREDFNGKLKVGVQIEHIQSKIYNPQYVTVNIPARQPMPDFFPRKQVLLYCGIASGIMFIVLIVGLVRKNRKTVSAAA